MSLIVKIISLEIAFGLSAPAADKPQYFVQISFNSTLQWINGISSDLQRLLKYFNGTAIVTFLKIAFALSLSMFSNNLVLYPKYLKLLLLSTSALKLVALSLE